MVYEPDKISENWLFTYDQRLMRYHPIGNAIEIIIDRRYQGSEYKIGGWRCTEL